MSVDIKEAHVKTELHNGVATIEFFHPQSNALPARILEQLAHAIHSAGNDPEVKVVLLRSGGEKAFCAGASFNELSQIENEKKGFDFFSGFADVINAMRKCPKLIIGRIHGKCIGGGVGLAAAADYAIAHESADVRLSELAIGIGPFVVGPAIERRIGISAFGHLAIDAARWRNAEWSKKKGLFAEVHTTKEGMDESIFRLANELTHSSPQAMAELKKVLWKGTEHWDELLFHRAEISGKLVLSNFTKHAIEKFKSKV